MKLYIDRDLGVGIGHALRAVGVDVVLHSDRYSEADPPNDDIWIPEVTAEDRIILTHDAHIRARAAERAVFEAAGARCVVLSTRKATKFDNLRAVLRAWDDIEAHVARTAAPFMFGVDKRGRLTQYIPSLPHPPTKRTRRPQR